MKKILLILFILCGFGVFAQNRSVQFEAYTFDQALGKAKDTGKLLFVDCYTSWCGPCMNLAKNIFTNNDVADYFNQNFVSVKFDCEKGEGPAIAKRYSISGYPTLLFLKPDGSIYAKLMGGASDARQFIERIKKELDPDTSLAGKEDRYAKGERGKAFMIDLIRSYQDIRDIKKVKSLSEELLSSLSEKELLTAEIWPVISDYFVASYGQKWWNFMIAHSQDYERLAGAEAFGHTVGVILHPTIFSYTVAWKKFNSQEEYNTFKSFVNDYRIEDRKKTTLNQFLNLAYSASFEDFDSYFKKLLKIIPKLDKYEHFRLFTNLMDYLEKNVNAGQKKQLVAMLKKSQALQNDYYQKHYQELFDRVEKFQVK